MTKNSPPPALTRVYWLSRLAASLQRDKQVFDETPLNKNDIRTSTDASVGRTLNHLCTCLTRGTQSEASQAVAVTIGTYQVNGVAVQVFGTPESTPYVTPSLSSTSGVRVGQDAGSAVDGEWSASSVARDDLSGKYSFTVIGPEDQDALALIEKIIHRPHPMPNNWIPPSENFSSYVVRSLGVLRAAATLLKQTPGDPLVRRAVCIFFLSACLPKMRSRVNAFAAIYPPAQLRTWRMDTSDTSVVAAGVEVTDGLVEAALKKAGLVGKGQGRTFTFNADTIASWWNALVDLLQMLRTQTSKRVDTPQIVITSRAIHFFLRKVPNQLWRLDSLNRHLRECRELFAAKSPLNSRSDLSSTDDTAERDTAEEKLAIAEEVTALNDPIVMGEPTSQALPHCFSFYRATDAVTAWTTGPLALLGSRLAATTPTLNLMVVDLPRARVLPTTVEELVECWTQSGWTDLQRTSVAQASTSADPSTPPTDGACHAEAGLIASVLVRTKPRPQSRADVQSGDGIGQDEQSGKQGDGGEQGDLAKVFASMFDESASELKLVIGVAKKCCPVCRILVEVVQRDYQLKLDLPGQHGRFHPWVAPAWLPIPVLVEIEKRLLAVVAELVDSPLPGSRASSPANPRVDDENLPMDSSDLDFDGAIEFLSMIDK
ncbi:hypothetical protein C8R44DRAFT_824120 [Mycena epipterygia]|nr:hypothetical protein C8R44DRAFT_824120 [Mycena epipterygia]